MHVGPRPAILGALPAGSALPDGYGGIYFDRRPDPSLVSYPVNLYIGTSQISVMPGQWLIPVLPASWQITIRSADNTLLLARTHMVILPNATLSLVFHGNPYGRAELTDSFGNDVAAERGTPSAAIGLLIGVIIVLLAVGCAVLGVLV